MNLFLKKIIEYPDEAGVPIGGKFNSKYYLLKVHYENSFFERSKLSLKFSLRISNLTTYFRSSRFVWCSLLYRWSTTSKWYWLSATRYWYYFVCISHSTWCWSLRYWLVLSLKCYSCKCLGNSSFQGTVKK